MYFTDSDRSIDMSDDDVIGHMYTTIFLDYSKNKIHYVWLWLQKLNTATGVCKFNRCDTHNSLRSPSFPSSYCRSWCLLSSIVPPCIQELRTMERCERYGTVQAVWVTSSVYYTDTFICSYIAVTYFFDPPCIPSNISQNPSQIPGKFWPVPKRCYNRGENPSSEIYGNPYEKSEISYA